MGFISRPFRVSILTNPALPSNSPPRRGLWRSSSQESNSQSDSSPGDFRGRYSPLPGPEPRESWPWRTEKPSGLKSPRLGLTTASAVHETGSTTRSISVRVRVAVVALIRVGSLFTLRVEALPAAARGPVVRVAHKESAPRDALGVIDARTVEVVLAVPVDEDLESVDLDDLIAFVNRSVESEPVAESGASSARDVHPKVGVLRGPQRLARFRVVPLDQLLDLVRSGFCECDLYHRRSPRLSKTITPLFNTLRTVFVRLSGGQNLTASVSPCTFVPRENPGSRTHGARGRCALQLPV